MSGDSGNQYELDPSVIWANGDVRTIKAGAQVYGTGRVKRVSGEKGRLGDFLITRRGSSGTYIVCINEGEEFCSCPDWTRARKAKNQPCKHMWAALAMVMEETEEIMNAEEEKGK